MQTQGPEVAWRRRRTVSLAFPPENIAIVFLIYQPKAICHAPWPDTMRFEWIPASVGAPSASCVHDSFRAGQDSRRLMRVLASAVFNPDVRLRKLERTAMGRVRSVASRR